MRANEYQALTSRTLLEAPPRKYTDEEIMIIWCALGLAGEAGEAADNIKKAIFHDRGLNYEKIKSELGDVLWYVTSLCTKLGFDLDDVMITNVEKLQTRYPDGFKLGGGVREDR
jgi:NTP pyrophosphatase (non-canonical NTP hydrolase)